MVEMSRCATYLQYFHMVRGEGNPMFGMGCNVHVVTLKNNRQCDALFQTKSEHAIDVLKMMRCQGRMILP